VVFKIQTFQISGLFAAITKVTEKRKSLSAGVAENGFVVAAVILFCFALVAGDRKSGHEWFFL
jgi:hypothetical protein